MKSKLRKRLLGACLAGVLTFSCVAGVGAEDTDLKPEDVALNQVKISFSIGDEVIDVNGEKVTYVAPYVVNDVTLVPVRLLTESFGADVEWNEESQQATVTYGGVKIVLTIGSKTAYVDGEEVELLTAPEVTNDRTMLPLRFITETFGADVGWEEETQRVTVVKEVTDSNSIKDYALLLKRSDKAYVGDSYLGWSMKRSDEFQLAKRSFDGYQNSFTSSDSGSYKLVISQKDPENDTPDIWYQNLKNIFSSMTIIDFEKKKTSTGIEYVDFQAKNKSGYLNIRLYFTEDMVYELIASLDEDKTTKDFENLMELIDTFNISFQKDQTEDLSDVNADNMRMFQSKDLKLSLLVPGDYEEINYGSNEVNVFRFSKKYSETTYLHYGISVYSQESGKTYVDWAKQDQKNNKRLLNPNYSSYSEVQETTIDGRKAAYYTCQTKDADETVYNWDVFVDGGDYFYNISFDVVGTKESADATAQKIMDSISIGEIDKNEMGRMVRISEEEESEYKERKDSKYSFNVSLPNDWQVTQENGKVFGYEKNGLCAFYMAADSIASSKVTAKEVAADILDDMKVMDNVELIDKAPVEISVGGVKGYSISNYGIMESGDKMRNTEYIFVKNQVLYIANFSCPDKYYGERTQEIQAKIIESITLK